jgi:hypothetical protein
LCMLDRQWPTDGAYTTWCGYFQSMDRKPEYTCGRDTPSEQMFQTITQGYSSMDGIVKSVT